MIPTELLLDYAERIDALDEHDRDRLLGVLRALGAMQDNPRVQPLYEALVESAMAVAENGLPLGGPVLAQVRDAIADLPDQVLEEQLGLAAASGRMPATLMGKKPGIGTTQAAWQTIAAILGAERRDREDVMRNAGRGSLTEGEGWYVPEGEPTPDPDDHDLELVDREYSPPDDGGLPQPDDAPESMP